jgi:hypothetical protein
MSGTIAVLADASKDVSTSSFVFDVLWRILLERSHQKPFEDDTAYLSSLSWREKSYDCFLDLRKCQRPTLEAIRELMLQHAESGHPYWESYYGDNFAAIRPGIEPAMREEEEKFVRLGQAWAQKAMTQVAEAIAKRLEMEASVN